MMRSPVLPISDHRKAVIQADFATYRPVPSRRVLQLVLEVPLERQAEVFAAIGWPDPEHGLPVAVARLQQTSSARAGVVADRVEGEEEPAPICGRDSSCPPSPEGSSSPHVRRKWTELRPSQQAGILCADKRFWRFLTQHEGCGDIADEAAAAQAVRQYCRGISSRAELDINPDAAAAWRSLLTRYRQAAGLEAEMRG